MSKFYSIGELLIDFKASGFGALKDSKSFEKNAGGAPANVCVQVKKLGFDACYLTKVGQDAFGEFLIETLKGEGVDTRYILQSPGYDTSLAFVSLSPDGERQFTFYRRSAADLHFDGREFDGVEFEAGDLLEFGSVALASESSRALHEKLIARARASGAIVCFDPNLRFNLWESAEELKEVVLRFLPYADVVKAGKDEWEFLTGSSERKESAFAGNAKLFLLTDGGRGAALYLKDGRQFFREGYKVHCVDATGAGDSFFGGFLAELMRNNIGREELCGGHDYAKMLDFACKCGAYTTTGYGAISALADRKTILETVK